MNTEEALKITRVAKAAWPASRWDEYTIDVWVQALQPHDLGEARAAIDRLVTKQTFVSIAELIREINTHHRDAVRHLRDRETFRQLETARDQAEQGTSGYEHARQAFAEAIAIARAKRGETDEAEPQTQEVTQ